MPPRNHDLRMTIAKIGRRIDLIMPLIYRRKHALEPFRYRTLPDASTDPAPFVGLEVDDSDWGDIAPNTYWAQQQENFVMRGAFNVPDTWDTSIPTALYLPIGEAPLFEHPEALIYVDGAPYATVDRHHQEILLPDTWRDGATHTLAMHGWTGNLPRDGKRLFMNPCYVVQIDTPTRDFLTTAQTAHELVQHLDANDPIYHNLLNALDDAFKLVDLREPFGDDFYTSIADAQATLQAGIDNAGAPLDLTITAAGHAHIDVAWLWTLAQTRRKAGRTFHTVLRLMEQYPEYVFTQSQPQLYDYVRQDYPDLFEAMKGRIAEGRIEPIGGMWVEADCNISGGESLVRQFMLGRRFFREHFGEDAESPVLWLPDVFGYAWNLPQLIKEAGLDYFFTIKIGWNQVNELPFSSFWWQGLDGTRVLTHFSPTPEAFAIASRGTYNAEPSAKTIRATWTNYRNKSGPKDVLMSYGWGDGGGGPTREMLDNMREMAHFPGLPKVESGKVIDFFHKLESQADTLPVWNGELYLEIHRGTYTTQARNKRANRQSEFLLHDAEFLATVASLLDSDYAYPYDTFNKAWELVCLNQFHDIIPGSSITEVYTDSLAQYDQVREMVTTAQEDALNVIRQHIAGDVLLINPTSFGGQQYSKQKLADVPDALLSPDAEDVLIHRDFLPYKIEALSVEDIESGQYTSWGNTVEVTPRSLENTRLRVELDDNGDITRIFDKFSEREVLPAGEIADQWIVFEDRPINWDAWDVDVFYEDKSWLAEPATSIEIVEAHPLRATIEVRRRILNSDFVQRISLDALSNRIDFDNWIDWREKHILLKTAFPVNILSPVATYEIQWGHVQRPTHRNTSWDQARFETCAQKWVDLSELEFGVALLNDGKYGYDIHDNIIRMSLLRAPTYPDPTADQGEHRFKYSLLVHDGDIGEDVMEEAYHLNDPFIVTAGGVQVADTHPMLRTSFVNADNVVIETVKRAEDGNGVIVRCYEPLRWRGTVSLKTAFKVKEAYRTNILEEDQAQLDVRDDGHSIKFDVTPFKIVTLRLIPAE